MDLDNGVRPQLFTLIDGNCLKEARKLLQANPSVIEEVEPETGWYPTHLAACEGRTKFLRVFVSEFGANTNNWSRFSRSTPLNSAVGGKKTEAMKVLLNMGAGVDAKAIVNEDDHQYTPLELAMQQYSGMCPSRDEMEIIGVSLQGGANYLRHLKGIISTLTKFPIPYRWKYHSTDLGYPIIYSASQDINLVRLFSISSARIRDQNSRLVVHYRCSLKDTIFHFVVIYARLDALKILLELGAYPGLRYLNG